MESCVLTLSSFSPHQEVHKNVVYKRVTLAEHSLQMTGKEVC